MPTVKIERWICERCKATADAPEREDGQSVTSYVQPEGWTFADASPAFEGPLCPRCIKDLQAWLESGQVTDRRPPPTSIPGPGRKRSVVG